MGVWSCMFKGTDLKNVKKQKKNKEESIYFFVIFFFFFMQKYFTWIVFYLDK